MAITAIQAAKIFIDKSLQEKEGVKRLTHLQVQKFVYFLHGWNYAARGERLIADDVEAWTNGPVYPKLHDKLEAWGSDNEITETISDVKLPETLDEDTMVLFDVVYDVGRKYSGLELSNITHQINSPWFEVFFTREKPLTVIPEELISEYFTNGRNKWMALNEQE